MYFPIGWPKRLKFIFQKPPLDEVDGEINSSHNVVSENGVSPPNGDHHSTSGATPEDLSVPQHCDRTLLQVVANSDRTLFAILTSRSVHVWFSKVG